MLQTVGNLPSTNGWLPRQHTPALIRRPRLLWLIEHPFLAPVTVMTAPAGFGKSTLAAQWAQHTSCQVVWVALEPANNSLSSFVANLLAAIEGAPAGQRPVSRLGATIDDVAAELHRLVDAGTPPALILDDYHLIENRDVHQAMDGLLATMPAAANLIVLSRTMPPLTLGRRRALGQVRHLTARDLSFTFAEAEAVVAGDAATRLTPAQVKSLVDRTEGWIVGIRLALLAIAQLDAARIDPFIDAFASHEWLDEYIVEEVLDALPEPVRAFVLRTANLGTLRPELCDVVLGIDHSAALIDDVAKRLVFARRENRGEATVTYHALFADCVARIARRHVPTDERLAHHRRAAHWFEQHGHPEAAVEHALKGEDLETAVRLTKTILPGLMDVDWSHSAIYLLRRLPVAMVAGDPDLAYGFIHSHFMIGQAREARQMLDQVERAWMASGDPVQQGRALACSVYSRVLWGDSSEAELQALRHQALALLPEDCAVERLHLWGGIAAEAYFHGNDEVGEEAYRQAETYAARLPSEQNYWLVANTIQRPNQVALRGNLPVAIALYERALEQIPARLRYWEGSYRQRLAVIHLERGDLAQACAQAGRYEPDLVISPWEAWHCEAWITSAQIKRATGEIEAAYALVERAIASIAAAGNFRMAHDARALQAAWWLADGELDRARGWDQTTPAAHLDWARAYGLMHGQLTRIQLRAAGGDYAGASALARELIAEGERLKRWADLVPIHVWEAVAQLGLGDAAAALEALRAALRLGMPGGFVRSFFPPGADVRPVLRDAVHQLPPDEAAYVRRLLNDDTSSPPLPDDAPRPDPGPALPEPLSAREVEVLALLHEGLTNREIADRLFISQPTVKMHVGNLLTKLGVSNRTYAVIRALELGLLR